MRVGETTWQEHLESHLDPIEDLDEATGAQDVELDDEGDADAGSDHDMVAREQVTLNLGPKFEEVASVSVSWQPLL